MVSKKHFRDKPAKQREKIIRDRLGFADDWKPDEIIINAMQTLEADTKSTNLQLYESVLESLLTTRKVLDRLRNNTEEALDRIEDVDVGVDKDKIAVRNELVKTLRDDILFILKTTKELPHSISQLEILVEKIEKEEQSNKTLQKKEINAYESSPSRFKRTS